MKFKSHILMTSAAAALAMSALGTQAFAQAAPATPAAAPSSDSTTVVVTGIRKSLQSSLRQKKNAEGVEEIITAEDVGKFPDKNVADALSRVSGVNVTTGTPTAGGFGENERVAIRGTDPELTLTLLDGHSVSTGDWFVEDQANGGRSFNYTMLPSDMIGTAEVLKAAKASDPEGGVAGTVDVHMRNPLDLPSGMVSGEVQALYSSLPDKISPFGSIMYNWKNDGHTFGILVSAYYEQREFRRDGQETLGYQSTVVNGKTLYMPSLIGSAYFTQQRTRSGLNFNSQWKPSDNFELDVSGIYTYLRANNENHNFMVWGAKLAGDTPNPGYTTAVAPDGNTYLTSATYSAANTSSGSIVQDDIPRTSHSDSATLNVDATWHILPDLTAKGQIGYTSGGGYTDDTVAWETYWKNTNVGYTLGKPTQVSTGLPASNTSAAYLNNYFSWSWGGKESSPDREAYAKLDFDYSLDNGGIFKDVLFGARATDHTRKLIDDAFGWAGNGADSGTQLANLATTFTGNTTPSDYASGVGNIPGYSFSNTSAIYNYVNSHNGGRIFGFYGNDSFAVHERTQAYYLMTKVGGDRWFGDIGVRAVHTDDVSTQYQAAPATALGAISSLFGTWVPHVTTNNYWDVLPSAEITYKATDDFLIRADASEVMTRPSYAQMAGYFYLVDANYSGGSGGNPDLKPYKASQLNLSAEWYYTPESLLAVTLYDLDISNYISTGVQTGFYTDQANPQGHNFTLTGPANGGAATDKGVELTWQQPIGAGFGFESNLTYADGRAAGGGPLIYTSKYTYNLTGYYEKGPITTRLSWNYRSHFYLGYANSSPDYQDNYGQLDGSFAYQLTPNLSLNIDAQNILHEKEYYYDMVKWLPRAVYDNGQTLYVGVRFKY